MSSPIPRDLSNTIDPNGVYDSEANLQQLKPEVLLRQANKYHKLSFISNMQDRLTDRFLKAYGQEFYNKLMKLDVEYEQLRKNILAQNLSEKQSSSFGAVDEPDSPQIIQN